MSSVTIPNAAQRQLQLRAARTIIARELGPERLAALHKPNPALDFLSVAGGLALFITCAYVLGSRSYSDILWWLCLIVQGDLILVLAFINHDAFAHRKLLPPPWRWVVSSLLVWPSQLRAAVYERMHLTHHRELGTDRDSEAYKQDIDTPLKRFLYASPAAVLYRFIFLSGRTASVALQADGSPLQSSADPGRERWERGTRIAILGATVLVALLDWRFVVYGYLVPLVFITPVFNTVRMVLEHFDLRRENPFWVGTFYRTGPLTRLLFWWGGGDCHMVHHFYANIPFYRIPKALELIRPILMREGVHEQRSLPRLLSEWFRGSRPHWSVPAQARDA